MGSAARKSLLGIVISLSILAQGEEKTGGANSKKKTSPAHPPPARPQVKPIIGGAIPTPDGKGVSRFGTVPNGQVTRLQWTDELRAACPESGWKSANNICESTAPIPTAGVRVDQITILSAVRMVQERADHRGEFVFEFQCTSGESYVDIEVSTVLNPGVATENRRMKTAQPCASGSFIWRPVFTGVTGETKNLSILVTEIRMNGDPIVVSPIVHAPKIGRAENKHGVTFAFPRGIYQSLVFVSDNPLGPVTQETVPTGSIRLQEALDAGDYRILPIISKERAVAPIRLRVTPDVR